MGFAWSMAPARPAKPISAFAGGNGRLSLFIHGQPIKKLTGDNILDQFMEEIYDKIWKRTTLRKQTWF